VIQATLEQLTGPLQGQLHGDSVAFSGVTTDSRQDCSGQLFVALKGDNFDAHEYLPQARERGAVAALVEQPVATELPRLQVDNTLRALGQMGRWWVLQNPARRVAITGSNGKTTVKEMTAAILRQKAPTLMTQGNLNNHIGVPLTLLQVNASHRFAVIEMGANHAGEIAYLAQLAKPQVALINNAAEAHIEGFGSLQGVRKAKGELYEQLDESALAVFNADDPACAQWQALHPGSGLRFSLQREDVDVCGQWHAWAGGIELQWQYQQQQGRSRLKVVGEHNARNALAAVSLAYALEIPTALIEQGLNQFEPVSGRLQSLSGPAGSVLINDSYNANPASLRAGVDALMAQPGEAWVALGDMAELGADAEQEHAKAGRYMRDAGVSRLFAVGPMSLAAVQSFGAGAEHFADVTALAKALGEALHSEVSVLLKGSRCAAMERVVQQLQVEDSRAL